MQPSSHWGVRTTYLFSCLVYFLCNSFLVYLCASLNQLRVPHLASWPPPFFLSLSLKALLNPDRLAGDKTWTLGEKRDIWEQDGERDGGRIPMWSPSSGSVETVTARRWVPFTACMQYPAVQHLLCMCRIMFL